uniref:Uncharacterized protein n=1 Tax=Fagus sylvatica TaxID=28930 RepID=A0A2N9GSR7_FAGSY
MYSFLTRFSRAVLEVFWCSKWVMRHIFGKLSSSTFQRYKVCANQSSDERVMAPGSQGAGAIFGVFPVKIPVKRGMPPANRELHVVARVVIFPTHPGSRVNLHRFSTFWYRRKAYATFSCKVLDLRETELGMERYGSANRGRRSVFGPLEDIFPIEIPARPGEILAIREFHAVHGCVLFLTCPGLRINLLYRPCTEASLGSQDMILQTEAVGMFLMPMGHFPIEIPA